MTGSESPLPPCCAMTDGTHAPTCAYAPIVTGTESPQPVSGTHSEALAAIIVELKAENEQLERLLAAAVEDYNQARAENEALRAALERLGMACVMGSRKDIEAACLKAREVLR